LRKLTLLILVFALFGFTHFASAQQADAMFGFGTITSSGSCNLLTDTCPEKGGLYPNVGFDVIFHKHIGFGYEIAWRGGQGEYGGNGGQPFRPILSDFNAVYQPRIAKKVGLDLMGGVGWQSTRFYGYQPTGSCVYFGACYVSEDHFLVHIGGGVRYYVWNHFFVRPEAHYYWIQNNTNEFTSNNILRIGASIGYTIGGRD
jgi:hypothetical protein